MANAQGDNSVVHFGDEAVPRVEVLDRAARVAAALREGGAGPGSAVAVLLRNDIAFLEVVLGAGMIGAQAVPLNWHGRGDEITYILDDARAGSLVVHADLLGPLLGSLPERVLPIAVPTPPAVRAAYGLEDEAASVPGGIRRWPAWRDAHAPLPRSRRTPGGVMMYTSGTTGRPKGVRRAVQAPERRAEEGRLRQAWFGNRPGLRTAIVGPLYHSVQLSYALAALNAPGDLWVQPRFDAGELLALVERHRLTHLHLVPVMMQRLLSLPEEVRAGRDLSSLEVVVHGSAPCPAHVKYELIEWLGPIVHEYYGTTECGMVARCSTEEWLARPGTVGRPWPGREVRILDGAGRALLPGEEGDVYISLGPMPDFTYMNHDAARQEIDRDGLVTCGDVGYLDEDGFLYLCDRRNDLIISGGANIYPAEIEAALARHPAVADAAAFGVPDDEYGERPHAAVRLHDDAQATPAELRAAVRALLPSFKVPDEIELRAELPRDESGKIARHRLRAAHWAGTGRRI